MADTYDIVIIGAGPVGLMLSACLLRLGAYKIKHIDNHAEPTKIGRADGIQARTLDVLENLGLKRSIMDHNPGRVYEVAFWKASDGTGIQRTGNSRSYPDYIDTRYPFSTIINQGIIEKTFLDDLENRGLEIQRPWTIKGFRNVDHNSTHPLEVDLMHIDGNKTSTLKTKYIFGADGARSTARELLNIPMISKDPIVHVWSVIDGVVKSDFPDMQIKCTIQSSQGSSMIIPQGNNRVRLYLQIFPRSGEQPLVYATLPKIQEMANVIFSPYKVEWECVDWHSAYRIGQAVASSYTPDQRVFIGGDACHTHSPKAGQGMNYGFLDAHNLAWKLHLVETGFMKRSLLGTYEEERRQAAINLIEFDQKYANLFSSRQSSNGKDQTVEFIQVHKENSLLTSGYGVSYPSSPLTWISSTASSSVRAGQSFPTAIVTRVLDARVAHLEQEVPFNGSYRIYVFAGMLEVTSQAISDLVDHISDYGSLFRRFQRKAVDISYERRHNPHADFFTFSVIINAPRSSIKIQECLPEFLAYYRHHIYADDHQWPSRNQANKKAAAHIKMGFDVEKGGVVVVRPDGYVGLSIDLVEGRGTADALTAYFASIVPENARISRL